MDNDMMSMISGIETLLSSVGFPIACCYFLWRYINTAMKEMTSVINHNTQIVNELLVVLKGKIDDINIKS